MPYEMCKYCLLLPPPSYNYKPYFYYWGFFKNIPEITEMNIQYNL